MDIEGIRALCGTDAEIVTGHCMARLEKRGIMIEEAEKAIMNGEIIEDYPDDYPFPSCLILGYSGPDAPLHVVCAVGDDHLYLITAYRPGPNKFEDDHKTRRKEETP